MGPYWDWNFGIVLINTSGPFSSGWLWLLTSKNKQEHLLLSCLYCHLHLSSVSSIILFILNRILIFAMSTNLVHKLTKKQMWFLAHLFHERKVRAKHTANDVYTKFDGFHKTITSWRTLKFFRNSMIETKLWKKYCFIFS